MSTMDRGWKTLDGNVIESLADRIKSDVENIPEDIPIKIYIGCDSQLKSRKVTFIEAIAIRKVGKGAICYFKKHVEKYGNDIRNRLWKEVYKVVDTAQWLEDDILADLGLCIEEIHADLNLDEKYLSSSVVQQAIGYIKAMGYDYQIKPGSWCASKIADRKSK